MARRGLSGQLNMFDFFRELEAASPQAGEVEMVSLMPEREPEPEETPKSTEISDVEETPDATGIPNAQETSNVAEIPDVEETPDAAEISNAQESSKPAMHRTYATGNGTVEIAYIDYSKVRLCEPGKEPVIKEFATTKEAVDYYVEQMQKFETLYGDEEAE